MPQIQIRNAEQQRIAREVWAIINALPHREAIREGDARQWVDTVVGTYGELAKWHATRAGGFGGSQIGALVRNFHGQRADHMASARKIVEGTLLRSVPDEPNGQMQRGIDMEPSHRKWFLRKYGAHRDEKGLEILSKSTGMRPWMRYSPDELAFMPSPIDSSNDEMQRWLGDYKAPTEVEKKDKVSFQYVAQLHMGRLVCEHNGLKIDGMILSQFDWGSWSLKDDVIPYIPELDQMIIQAGDHYWDYVMRGELPPYILKERLENSKEIADALAEDAFRLSRIKSMGKVFTDAAEDLQKRMVERLQGLHFGSSALSIANSLKVTAVPVLDDEKVLELVPEEILENIPTKENKSRYDTDKLLARVRETMRPGEKLKQFLAVGNMDAEALYQAAADAGIDAEALMKEQLRVSIDPTVAAEAQKFLFREFASLLEAPAAVEKVDAKEIVASLQVRAQPAALPMSVDQGLGDVLPAGDASQQENREGQHESRHVPRLISA